MLNHNGLLKRVRIVIDYLMIKLGRAEMEQIIQIYLRIRKTFDEKQKSG